MQAVQTDDKTINISREKLLNLFGQVFGGQSYPDQDDPQPPGRWDSYIRKVLGKLKGPHPEPWKAVDRHLGFGPTPEPWDLNNPYSFADLNPQPLPPRATLHAAIMQEVIDRAVLIQDVAEALHQTGEERAIIIVSGSVKQFADEIDELCPRLTILIHPPKGIGDPVPHPNWNAFELMLAASVFQQNALTIANESLRGVLLQASAKLAEKGIERM